MERRKDPVLKKIVLLCSVAALVAIYCFSAYSEAVPAADNLSVNEEEARSSGIPGAAAGRAVGGRGYPDLKTTASPPYDAETSPSIIP